MGLAYKPAQKMLFKCDRAYRNSQLARCALRTLLIYSVRKFLTFSHKKWGEPEARPKLNYAVAISPAAEARPKLNYAVAISPAAPEP